MPTICKFGTGSLSIRSVSSILFYIVKVRSEWCSCTVYIGFITHSHPITTSDITICVKVISGKFETSQSAARTL